MQMSENPTSAGQSAAPFSQNDYFRPQSSICSVEYKSRHGTGAIIGLEFPEDTWRTLFMTSYQVAPINDPNEITNLKVIFEDKTIGILNWTPNWVETLWKSPTEELDVTVIELSRKAMTIFSRTNVARLNAATAQDKEKISTFHYLPYLYNGSNEWALNIVNGMIDNINENIIEYSTVAKIESPGSPVMNGEFKIIGLESKNGAGPNKWKAISMNQILEAYKNYLREKYGGQLRMRSGFNVLTKFLKMNYKLIGCGGYGKVYKVIEPNDNVYALKLVEGFGGLDNYKSQVHALENEYRLVTSLQLHPRIIQFFAFVRDDFKARVVIIMEFLEGGSLHDKIKSNGCLNETVSLKYLGQLLEGIEFLHKNKIYHSDIKPANILFTRNDDIKLCDFGIAVHMHTESSATSSHVKGDRLYMSPERLNEDSRSAENDIWSVGATFATMISGHPLNNNDRFGDYNIAHFIIFINSIPLETYLKELPENDYKREIISRTLCPKSKRATAQELLEVCKRLTINSMEEPNRNPGAAVARPQPTHSTTTLQTDLAELSITDSLPSVTK